MRVYYDRDADTDPIKDPATVGRFVIGAVCAIAAVAIWAGWLVMMRVGITTTLTASDLTALRFAVAGIVLSPVVLRRGLAFNRLGWPGFMAVVIGAGFPVPLLVGAGLSFAPVAHASVLTYGVAPLIVACLAVVAFKERLVPIRKAGLVLVGLGGFVIGGLGVSSFDGRQSIGNLLFLTAACLWACYIVAIRRDSCDTARSPRRPARGCHRRRRLAARLYSLVLDLYRQPASGGALNRPRGSGPVSGRGGGSGLPCPIRPLNHAVGRIESGRLYRARAGHGGAYGHPSARRVAHLHRLACHRDDHGRRLSRQRRSSAGMDGAKSQVDCRSAPGRSYSRWFSCISSGRAVGA
jgi:hypothetical protein